MKYPKSIPKMCVRCGKDWNPKCCDYSYKAVEVAIKNSVTIAEGNRLMNLLEKCKGEA